MLIPSEKAISLWKTVHLASVLSNASHLRLWELSAWFCAWFLILVKWKFKALQELLLWWNASGSSQGEGPAGYWGTWSHRPPGMGCPVWHHSPGVWQGNTANCSNPARPDACEVCNGKVTWKPLVPCTSTRNQGMAGTIDGWVGIWPQTLWTSTQHPVKVLNQWDDAQIPLGASLTNCIWMAEPHFSHSSFFFCIFRFVALSTHFFLTLLFILTCTVYCCFTQQHPKTENGVIPHFFSSSFKKKIGNKKSSGLSLTFGNPDILCTKVSDIKADCFHAYISNIICFTSAYAQASWIPTVLLPVNVHSMHTKNGLSEPACLSTFWKGVLLVCWITMAEEYSLMNDGNACVYQSLASCTGEAELRRETALKAC